MKTILSLAAILLTTAGCLVPTPATDPCERAPSACECPDRSTGTVLCSEGFLECLCDDVPMPMPMPVPEPEPEPTADCLARIEGSHEAPEVTLEEIPEEVRTTTEMAGDLQLSCTNVTRDANARIEDIVALGSAFASASPGLVVNASAIVDGVVQPLSLPRAPVTLAIDVPVAAPTRRVDLPSSATLQTAVAELQREADGVLGSLPELPAVFSVDVFEAYDFEQAMNVLGISANYGDPFVRAGFDLAFGRERSARETTVVVRLYQPMYTISVAEDEIFQNRDFFRGDLDWSEGSAACSALDPNEPPAYLRSVTFGRTVYYAITSSDYASAHDLASELRVAISGVVAGGSVEASYADSYRYLMSRSTVRAVVFGGSQEAAFEAVRTGNYLPFFVASRAISAVPLAFRAHYLSAGRPLLTIAETTRFTSRCCVPTNCSAPPVSTHVAGSWSLNTGWHFGGSSHQLWQVAGGACSPGRTRSHVEGARAGGSGECYWDWVSSDPTDCRVALRYSRPGSNWLECAWTLFEQQVEPHPDPLCRGVGC